MTLHEALRMILLETKRRMTTQELADIVNDKKLYTKRDESLVTAYQIHGRTSERVEGSIAFRWRRNHA